MERLQQKAGVAVMVALLAAFIVLYSLWGASILRAGHQANAQGGVPVATNI